MATTRQPRFAPGLSQEELVRGYKKIGSRKPFTRKDLAKALKPYRLKLTKPRRTTSDRRLMNTAAKAVVAKYKRNRTHRRKKR